MEAYRYKAINAQGRVTQGRVDAVNPADLETRLARMGLDLVNFKELPQRNRNVTGRGIQRIDLITFCFHLEQLVRAGEESGQLTTVLRKIIDNLKWQDEQAAYTKQLLLYPAIVSVIVLIVVFFLMLYVVPQLVTFLATMGQNLPLQTRALIATSKFLTGYWYLVLGLPVLGAIGAFFGFRSNPRFAEQVDEFWLHVPLVGPVLKKLIVTRVCNVFSIMYSSGITVLECVRAAENVAGNRAVANAMREAGRLIADGGGISRSFATTGLFPPLVIRMLRVGENTGALENALDNVSYFYTRDVAESVARLQTMIMPIVTTALGLVLFWIIAAVLGPIYDLFTKIDF